MFLCPACKTRCTAPQYAVDYEHECPANTGVPGRQDRFRLDVDNALLRGSNQKLQGTRAWIEGERHTPVTDRGYNANLYEDVVRQQYVKLEKGRIA